MKACIRRYDHAVRYGGEEFLFVLPSCDLRGAWAQAERVREAIASKPFAISGDSLTVTCSLGLACRSGDEPADTSALLREADCGLYAAKDEGRNRVGGVGVTACPA